LPRGASAEQARLVKECLFKIDQLISSECFFCGPILLDMIDNDAELDGVTVQGKRQIKLSEWDFI
jgi:hypothetical protein